MEPGEKFIPALGRDFFTPSYDVVIRLTLPERRFKLRLIESAELTPGMKVLDIGCGTGTLLVLTARTTPGVALTGIDVDSGILARARRKIAAAGLDIQLDRGSATNLPYPEDSFDRIFSTLTLHHLTGTDKAVAFAEAYRTLGAGGELHVSDVGAPDTRLSHFASYLTEKLGGEHVQENYRGLLMSMAREAGFAEVVETARFFTVIGIIRSFRATKNRRGGSR